MIYLKTDEEIELMRESNLLVGMTLGEMAKWIAPGITTLKLDKIAEEFIRDHGAQPGFLGYGGFPNTLCISVNEVEAAVPVKAEAAPVEKEAKAAPAKKTTARKTAAKTTSKKETAPKEAAKKEAAPKAEAKKEAAPKAAAKKETAKKAPAKKAAEPKAAVHFQFDGKDLVAKDVLDRSPANWTRESRTPYS